jgi:hypothetical protein
MTKADAVVLNVSTALTKNLWDFVSLSHTHGAEHKTHQWARLIVDEPVIFTAATWLPNEIHDVARLPGCDVISNPVCP